MKLYSAAEDFEVKTLAAIPGLLGKVRYVVSLRGPDGEYQHWGLERVYGKPAAQLALSEIYRNLLGEVLRTPIRELFEDAVKSAAAAGVPLPELLEEIQTGTRELALSEVAGGSVRHFSTVLQALSLLEKSGKDASRRVS